MNLNNRIFRFLPVLLVIGILMSPSFLDACDTWVALGRATLSGITMLAKNSDRTVFDSQPLFYHPHQQWPAEARIDLGRIAIPQVRETFATIGSSPYWCWGYEEGLNEFGVAIGNEGVFTKDLARNLEAVKQGTAPKPGPTGMDLVRLGLERGKTAREALDVITGLVETYGQFGSGLPGLTWEGAYDNAYIIADADEAYTLETSGTRWAAKRISQGIASISNALTIGSDWDLASGDLKEHAVRRGWWPSDDTTGFDFASAYSDDTPLKKAAGRRAKIREACSYRLLQEKQGRITPRWMMRIARDRSTNPSLDLDVTASSCVVMLPASADAIPVFWWCAATPSSSCYVPFFVHGTGLPAAVSRAGVQGRKILPPRLAKRDDFSPESYWWLFRDLCTLTNRDGKVRNPIVRAEFDRLEEEFAAALPGILDRAVSLRKTGKSREAARLLDEFSAECVEKARAEVNSLRARFHTLEADHPERFRPFVGRYNANFGSFRDIPFTIFVKNEQLALDIPGQMVLEFDAPDGKGRWISKRDKRLALSFIKDDSGRVVVMKLHRSGGMILELPKLGIKRNPPLPLEDIQKYLGRYYGKDLNETLEIVIKNQSLALKIPGQKTYELRPPDEEGRWYFRVIDQIYLTFTEAKSGGIDAFNYHEGGKTLLYSRNRINPKRHADARDNGSGLGCELPVLETGRNTHEIRPAEEKHIHQRRRTSWIPSWR